jgi:hypothetical protein
MFENSLWHGSKPAPDLTHVGWSNPEGVFEKQRPEIEHKSGAQPHEYRADEGDSQTIHGSPAF